MDVLGLNTQETYLHMVQQEGTVMRSIQGCLDASEMQDLSLRSTSRIWSAFATFMEIPEDLKGSFVESMEIRFQKEEFDSQSLCNLLWALSVSRVREEFHHYVILQEND